MSRIVIIAESGSTKTDWAFLRAGQPVLFFKTAGINAALTPEPVVETIMDEAVSRFRELDITGGEVQIRFFSAGIVSPADANRLRNVIGSKFGVDDIYVDSDLMAASIALFGNRPGIVAILGTGSNSCLYDGRQIAANVRPGGFILGDEGGGAAIGKLLLSDYIKGFVSAELVEELESQYDLNYQTIVANVYSGSAPAAYLASFAPFVISHKDHEDMADLLRFNFEEFVERALTLYQTEDVEAEDLIPVGMVGSIANECRDIIEEVLNDYGFTVASCIKSPIEELVKYYGNDL